MSQTGTALPKTNGPGVLIAARSSIRNQTCRLKKIGVFSVVLLLSMVFLAVNEAYPVIFGNPEDISELVVSVRVLSIETFQDAGGTIYTDAAVSVEKVIKGRTVTDTLSVEYVGGEINGRGYVVFQTGHLRQGQRYTLYLNRGKSVKNGKDVYNVVHVQRQARDRYAYLIADIPTKWTVSRVKFEINTAGAPVDGSRTIIINAMNVWNVLNPTVFTFVDNGNTTSSSHADNNDNIVFFKNPVSRCPTAGACAGANYKSIGSYYQLYDCDIGVNIHIAGGVPWSNSLLKWALAHEFGHCLGLGHSSVSSAVMNAMLDTQALPTALDSDDKAGFYTLYPLTSEQTITAVPLTTTSGRFIYAGALLCLLLYYLQKKRTAAGTIAMGALSGGSEKKNTLT